MKIAINTLPLYKTKVGMGRYIVELVNNVPDLDKLNNYLFYVSKENKKFFDLNKKNVEVIEIPSILTPPFVKILWEHFILPISLRKNKVDLYHAPGFVLPLFDVLSSKKMKKIITVADMTFFSHSRLHVGLKNKYFRILMPASIKKADRIITISENTKKDVLAHIRIGEKKVVSIHLAVDDIFTPKKESETIAVRNKYNITSPYILFVGMLEPRKNLEGLLKAFASIKDKVKHKLVIVGKVGWKYDHIFNLINELNLKKNVIFTGYVPDHDLPALYSNATCFVYPSFYEGFGIPVLEAMACGCPVITSDNSSLKEIAGNAAILVNPHDIDEIKDAILELIANKDKRNMFKHKGLKQIKMFSWKKMAKKTISLYHGILYPENL